MELATLLTFGGVLILCILFHLPLLAALLFGLGLFASTPKERDTVKKKFFKWCRRGSARPKTFSLSLC